MLGKWKVESGEWRVENGEWRVESGILNIFSALMFWRGVDLCRITESEKAFLQKQKTRKGQR